MAAIGTDYPHNLTGRQVGLWIDYTQALRDLVNRTASIVLKDQAITHMYTKIQEDVISRNFFRSDY